MGEHISCQDFIEGVQFGAEEVINMMRNRIYYMPECWKKGEASYIFDIMEKTLQSAERIYLHSGGVDNG